MGFFNSEKEKMLEEHVKAYLEHIDYLLTLNNTTVQLGQRAILNGKNFFKVEFELEANQYINIKTLLIMKEQTGLSVRIRVANIKNEIDYVDVDPTDDGYGGYGYKTVVEDIESSIEYRDYII